VAVPCCSTLPTRRFTGKYDCHGEPHWSEDDLLVESVYRYKGRSTPAAVVVVVKFAFDKLDRAVWRCLFVALTPPQMAAELVLPSRVERCLTAVFEQESVSQAA